MTLSLLGSIILVLLTNATAFAEQIEIGKCYFIDEPANIRNSPKGNIIDSLPSGEIVIIRDKQGVDWLEIEYSSNSDQGECPPRGKLKKGWTYHGNLFQEAAPLEQLVKDSKVLIAGHMLVLGREATNRIIGATVKCESNKDWAFPKFCKPFSSLVQILTYTESKIIRYPQIKLCIGVSQLRCLLPQFDSFFYIL